MTTEPIRIGVAGCRRGASLARLVHQLTDVAVTAAFDPDPGAGQRFREEFADVKLAPDFAALLESGVDLVYLASPEQHHAPQAIAALAAGTHVLSEVPAVVSVSQAHQLVGAVRRSQARYMLAENYCYTRANRTVSAMVRAGLLGTLYYGEGDFIQDMLGAGGRGAAGWQRHWHLGRNAITYPTHTLGPLLGWFGTRIVAVAATGSGRHAEYPMESTLAMTARTAAGSLLRMRFDLLSPRPAERMYYAIQGTGGCYEAGRGGAPARVYVAGQTREGEWEPIDRYQARFAIDQDGWPSASSGSPLLPAHALIEALRHDEPAPIDIYRALDMTLPGLYSEESVSTGGAWVGVPDPRHFTDGIDVATP